MFFKKQIEGEIIECVIRREYMFPRRYTKNYRELKNDFDYEYEHYDEFETANDYYVEYQVITVKFLFFGEERVEKFNNITLQSHYKASDRIILVYNKFDKTFSLKD